MELSDAKFFEMGNASNLINFHTLRYGKRNRPAQTADYTRGPLINHTSKTKYHHHHHIATVNFGIRRFAGRDPRPGLFLVSCSPGRAGSPGLRAAP